MAFHLKLHQHQKVNQHDAERLEKSQSKIRTVNRFPTNVRHKRDGEKRPSSSYREQERQVYVEKPGRRNLYLPAVNAEREQSQL